jgi:phosphomannomutase
VTGVARADVIARARRWLDADPDPDTRTEMQELIDGPGEELEARFSGRLEFGTAGLRGELGAGPLRMNRVLVRKTASGLGRVLTARGGDRVAIGFDARHKSDVFAEDTARVLASMGIECRLLDRPAPTPVLAFAVRHLNAAAGVMVTASHNPRADNGFKVYWSDGAQIVPPIDREISAEIDSVGPLADEALADRDDVSIVREGMALIDSYVEAVADVVSRSTPRSLSVVYTPVHGVGRDVLLSAFERAGFARPSVVPQQSEPDPDFPTAAFPNPEEEGVLDLAVARAEAETADLVLANDPDADRLAVVVPIDGEWRRLTGDEIGCLLAEHVLASGSGSDRVVVTTVVSSRLLSSIAADHGVEYRETLTGFKWIMRPAIEEPDLRFVFGYEEALGYAVGDVVRDKDGISAALAFAELAAEARVVGVSVGDRLDDLFRRHGVHLTDQRSFRFAGADAVEVMSAMMSSLREDRPADVGGVAVTGVTDLLGPDTGLPPTDALAIELENGCRLVLRPSGTEPKLKLYGESIVEVVGDDLDGSRRTAAARLEAALSAMTTLIAPTPHP